MVQFADILHNRVLIISICGWAAAQILKTIIYAITNKTLDWERLIGDGGMPSAHLAGRFGSLYKIFSFLIFSPKSQYCSKNSEFLSCVKQICVIL